MKDKKIGPEPPVLTPKDFAKSSGLTLREFERYRAAGLGPEHIVLLDDDRVMGSAPLFLAVNGEMFYTFWGLSVWNQLRRDGDLQLR